MSKQPDIKTITDVWKDKSEMNYNWEQISKAFENTLSRTGDTPNAMEDDFDIADASILNVNVYKGDNMLLNGWDILGYEAFLMWKINNLPWDTQGQIVFAPEDDEVGLLDLGSAGQMLKSTGVLPYWGEDIDTDTDTDTIGVTVQEDGVTVAENVTQIDFLWTNTSGTRTGTLVTTPAGDQVDLALEELLGPPWEDATQADSNLDPSGSSMFSSPTEIKRIDLFTDAGIADAETGLSSGTSYTAIAQGENRFLIGAANAPGVWALGIRYFAADGVTPVGGYVSTSSATVGGANLVYFRNISSGTRYVEWFWTLAAVSPGFLTQADFGNRYTAIINYSDSAANGGAFETPFGGSVTGTIARTLPP